MDQPTKTFTISKADAQLLIEAIKPHLVMVEDIVARLQKESTERRAANLPDDDSLAQAIDTQMVRRDELRFWLVSFNFEETYPPIIQELGVCGGCACVGRPPVLVRHLVELYQHGLSARGILDQLPHLEARELWAALDWALRHFEEVNEELQAQKVC